MSGEKISTVVGRLRKLCVTASRHAVQINVWCFWIGDRVVYVTSDEIKSMEPGQIISLVLNRLKQ